MVTRTKPAPRQKAREWEQTPIWDAEFADRWAQLHGGNQPPRPEDRRKPPRTRMTGK